MNVQDFFKKWISTRPNLKASFHDAVIEAMAFAEAYTEHQIKGLMEKNTGMALVVVERQKEIKELKIEIKQLV